MTASDLLMQFQADVLDVTGGPARGRPRPPASGAAYAAGLAVGFWPDLDALRANWRPTRTWTRDDAAAEREPATAAGARPSTVPSTGSDSTGGSDQPVRVRRTHRATEPSHGGSRADARPR